MKRILVITTLCILFYCTSLTAFANSSDFKVQTEYLGDGSYYETVLIQNNNSIITDTISTLSNSKTTAGSKTTYYKSSSGKVIWYVKVSGTFTYGGGTSKCTKASVTAESKDSGWKISNKSSWKKSNRYTLFQWNTKRIFFTHRNNRLQLEGKNFLTFRLFTRV